MAFGVRPLAPSSHSLHRDEDADRRRPLPAAAISTHQATGGTTPAHRTVRAIRRFAPADAATSSALSSAGGGGGGDSVALHMSSLMQPASAGLGLSSGLSINPKRDDDAPSLRSPDGRMLHAVQMEDLGGRGVSSASINSALSSGGVSEMASPDSSLETHMLLPHSHGPISPSHRRLMMAPVSGPPPSSLLASASAAAPMMHSNPNNWKVFEQGMRFGCMLSLLTWVMWDCIVDAKLRPAEQDLWLQLVLPIYRGFGCLLLLGWCAGISTFVWERYQINYLFLLDATPSAGSLGNNSSSGLMSYTEIWDDCTNITIVYLANFLLYFKVMRGDFPSWIPSGYVPVMFVVYITAKVLPFSYWAGFAAAPRNSAVWAGLAQVPLAPFGKVTFLTGYVGDIWTSMVKVSVDLAYTACFIASGDWTVEIDVLAAQREAAAAAAAAAAGGSGAMLGPGKIDTCFNSFFFKRALIPLLSALPLWLRMMQCLRKFLNTRQRWPHLANALKYAFAHSVVLFGVYNAATFSATSASLGSGSPLKVFWILAMVVSTLYTFWWDVFMDWGLGSWRHGGLREELMFKTSSGSTVGGGSPHRGVYYAAMAVDLVMRFAWTLTLIPVGEDSPFPPEFLLFLQPMLAAGEILRRTMWGFFRLEWEHISTQGYHRVPDAVVQPAHTPEMTGYRVILEVAVLVVMVLSVGTTAALTAN